jgi:hypothetical protein
MAERQPIFPSVTRATHALIDQVCEAQGCTQSDVVEGALLAFLSPRKTSDRDTLLFQKLSRLDKDVQSLAPLLERIIAYLAAQQAPSKPTVASYTQLYPTLQEAPVPAEEEVIVPEALPAQPGGWRSLFPRRMT